MAVQPAPILRRLAAALAFGLLLLLAASAADAQSFPKFTGFVVDAANVIPDDREAALTARLAALQKDTGRQLVVATIPDMQGYDLADYGNRLLRSWGVGLKDVNNGAILFIAPNEPAGHRGPRIEVGYGLEPVLTDALSSVIINTRMMPRLTAGDVPGALDAGADAVIEQLRLPDDQAKARLAAAVVEHDKAQRHAQGGGIPPSLIFWGIVLAVIVLSTMRGGGGGGGRLFRGGRGPIVLWGPGFGGGWGSGGGGSWGGGGSSDGGGWMGGGFAGGGGGSGGGGGASGGW